MSFWLSWSCVLNLQLSVFVLWCFFFFKQKTAYEMRISDWSSDVCSSDLGGMGAVGLCGGGDRLPRAVRARGLHRRAPHQGDRHPQGARRADAGYRAADRKSVV